MPDTRSMLRPVLLLTPVLLLAAMGWQRRWTSDDGFINLRIVSHIQAGHGPVFNADERVEAATSPLWVGLVTLADLASPLRIEHDTCVLALLLTIAGLGCAILGSRLLAHTTGHREDVLLPLGALVYAALPPAWDFATSGLENGLASAWMGAVWLALATRCKPSAASRGQPLRPLWLPVLLGLGPLVRPDCAIESGVFLLLLVLPHARRAPWRSLGSAACALALPLVVTFLRMGYYGSLVPNTALAKEASLPYWSQGWLYLLDFAVPYGLLLPLLVLLAFLVPGLRVRDPGVAPVRALGLAALVAAVLHMLFITRVGGDFMHGRMLLLPLFCALLPLSAVPVRGKRWIAAAGVAAWAVVCAAALRVPYSGVGTQGIADERSFYVELAGRANPVTCDDYLDSVWGRTGTIFNDLARENHRVLLLNIFERPEEVAPLRADAPAKVYAAVAVIGVIGYVAGSDVHIVDQLGLADPIVGRAELAVRGRPGHEKRLEEFWTLARYAPADITYPETETKLRLQLGLAREALDCPPLRELHEAVNAPLTPARFLANVRAAPRLTALRIPNDPAAALASLCPTAAHSENQ